jgi:hypothetical protein
MRLDRHERLSPAPALSYTPRRKILAEPAGGRTPPRDEPSRRAPGRLRPQARGFARDGRRAPDRRKVRSSRGVPHAAS